MPVQMQMPSALRRLLRCCCRCCLWSSLLCVVADAKADADQAFVSLLLADVRQLDTIRDAVAVAGADSVYCVFVLCFRIQYWRAGDSRIWFVDKQILVEFCCWNINDNAAAAMELTAKGGDDRGKFFAAADTNRYRLVAFAFPLIVTRRVSRKLVKYCFLLVTRQPDLIRVEYCYWWWRSRAIRVECCCWSRQAIR